MVLANRTLTAVPGLRVGHATDLVGGTGCTVVLAEQGATGVLVSRGAAVGGRQLGALEPGHVAPLVHGVLLAGGSTYGLDATGGVLAWLEERGVGLVTPAARVPIVPTVILYDLAVGRSDARPTPAMGRAACEAASDVPVVEGSIGAGTGATVGKLRGFALGTKGGLGSFALATEDGLVVAALAVVNAFGDVRDPETGRIVAGARDDGGAFLDSRRAIRDGALTGRLPFDQNTTLAVLATNARLGQSALHRAACLAAAAFPACISPVHTMVDGDVLIALSLGNAPAELHRVGLLFEEVLRVAILRGVQQAVGLHGVPAVHDLGP